MIVLYLLLFLVETVSSQSACKIRKYFWSQYFEMLMLYYYEVGGRLKKCLYELDKAVNSFCAAFLQLEQYEWFIR